MTVQRTRDPFGILPACLAERALFRRGGSGGPGNSGAGPKSRRARRWRRTWAPGGSVANFSAIERSVDGGRIRQFTADELFALSRGFGLPIGFFLTPPSDDPRWVRIATPDSKKQGGVDSMELLDAVLGTDESLAEWEGVLAIVGGGRGTGPCWRTGSG